MKRLLFAVLIGWFAASVALAQYSTLDRIQQRGSITFGVDPNNLPFSSATNQPPGFDIEIGQKIAERLGVAFKPVWVRSQHPSFPSQLMKKKCDGLIGVMLESFADAKGIAFTKPYYGTGFISAVRSKQAEGNRSLGVEAGVVLKRLEAQKPREYPSQAALLAAVNKGEVVSGYVGAVQAGWLLKNHPEWNVKLMTGAVPEDHWNLTIAVRKDSPELKAALDKAIQQMLDNNEIAPILNKYGIPFYAPFP